MICDTCGKETAVVSRVVIDRGYNRADARAVYNCPECFERKNQERHDEAPESAPASPSSESSSAAPLSPL